MNLARQVLPQIQEKALHIVRTTAIARTKPKTGHQPHLAQDRQQRMQARFGSHSRVAHFHPLLMSILVQQTRRVQIQGIASGPAGQTFQTPAKEWAKTAQVASRTGEPLKKSG